MDRLVNKNYARTRFVQNKTKYFQPLNTLLGLINKPRFTAIRYSEIAHLGEYKAIKMSARRKRIAKRGKFPDINPPHEYSSTLGDPTFYTLKQLPQILLDASNKRLNHISYWVQICEKLRKVKDIINVHHLLACAKCIVDANHYDPHLFKELTREFSDDFHLLNLDEIGILLRCYVIFNCKPFELLDKSLDILKYTIHNELNINFDDDSIESSSKSYEIDFLDKLSIMFTSNDEKYDNKFTNLYNNQYTLTQALAHISMSLAYYSYITPDINTLLSFYIIKYWKKFTISHFASVLRSLRISDDFFYNNTNIYNALLASINSFCQSKLPILYSDDNLIWGLKDIYKRVSNFVTTNDITNEHDYKILSIVDTIIHLCDMISIISDLRAKSKFDLWPEELIFSNIDILLESVILEYNYSTSMMLRDSKEDNKGGNGRIDDIVLKDYSIRLSFLNYALGYAVTKCSTAINSYLIVKISRHSILPFENKQRSLDKYHLEFTISEKIKYPMPPNWISEYESVELGSTILKIMEQCNKQIINIMYQSDPVDLIRMFENIVFLMKKVKNAEYNDNEFNKYLDLLTHEIIRKFQSIVTDYLQRLKNAVNEANYKNEYLDFYFKKYTNI